MPAESYCSNCGKQIAPDVRFCPECGTSIDPTYPFSRPVPATQVISPAPAPPSQWERSRLDDRPGIRRAGWLLAAAGGGGLLVLATAVFLGVLLLGRRNAGPGLFSTSPSPTAAPSATPYKAIATATPAFTGQQDRSDSHLFDDFSSSALGWLDTENTAGWAGYRDGVYVMNVTATDNGILAQVPLRNPPNHIEFSAQVTAGHGNGFYAVRCLVQSEVNYYEVWIDPAAQSYRFMHMDNSNRRPMTDWIKTAAFPDGGAGAVNQVAVDCQPGLISLWLNGQAVAEQFISAYNGKMYLVVLTYDQISGPVEVRFDNVEAWEQKQ